jgi:pterin-4a-carbinolamine dehydratase
MSLFDDDHVQLFFTDYQPTATVVHRVNARGDSVIHHPKP